MANLQYNNSAGQCCITDKARGMLSLLANLVLREVFFVGKLGLLTLQQFALATTLIINDEKIIINIPTLINSPF